MIWAFLAITLSMVIGFSLIIYQAHELYEQQRERQKEFQKWLFDSLYAIDHKVLLPDEHARPIQTRKAKVFIPSKAPMAEFNGNQDDWHE